MKDEEILKELEMLYKNFRDIGNFVKANEVMSQIIAIQTRNETAKESGNNILLG